MGDLTREMLERLLAEIDLAHIRVDAKPGMEAVNAAREHLAPTPLPSEKLEPDEFEVKYVPLGRLKASDWMQKMPVGMFDMIVDRHIRLRNEISRIIGEIELSYYRGREAGREEMAEAITRVRTRLGLVSGETPQDNDDIEEILAILKGTE